MRLSKPLKTPDKCYFRDPKDLNIAFPRPHSPQTELACSSHLLLLEQAKSLSLSPNPDKPPNPTHKPPSS